MLLIRHPHSFLRFHASEFIPKSYFLRQHIGIGLLAQLLAKTKIVCLG